MDGALAVLVRWLHIVPAALIIGGLAFMRIVLPVALRSVDEAVAREVFLRCRRGFKMIVHGSIGLLALVAAAGVVKWARERAVADAASPAAVADR